MNIPRGKISMCLRNSEVNSCSCIEHSTNIINILASADMKIFLGMFQVYSTNMLRPFVLWEYSKNSNFEYPFRILKSACQKNIQHLIPNVLGYFTYISYLNDIFLEYQLLCGQKADSIKMASLLRIVDLSKKSFTHSHVQREI